MSYDSDLVKDHSEGGVRFYTDFEVITDLLWGMGEAKDASKLL